MLTYEQVQKLEQIRQRLEAKKGAAPSQATPSQTTDPSAGCSPPHPIDRALEQAQRTESVQKSLRLQEEIHQVLEEEMADLGAKALEDGVRRLDRAKDEQLIRSRGGVYDVAKKAWLIGLNWTIPLSQLGKGLTADIRTALIELPPSPVRRRSWTGFLDKAIDQYLKEESGRNALLKNPAFIRVFREKMVRFENNLLSSMLKVYESLPLGFSESQAAEAFLRVEAPPKGLEGVGVAVGTISKYEPVRYRVTAQGLLLVEGVQLYDESLWKRTLERVQQLVEDVGCGPDMRTYNMARRMRKDLADTIRFQEEFGLPTVADPRAFIKTPTANELLNESIALVEEIEGKLQKGGVSLGQEAGEAGGTSLRSQPAAGRHQDPG